MAGESTNPRAESGNGAGLQRAPVTESALRGEAAQGTGVLSMGMGVPLSTASRGTNDLRRPYPLSMGVRVPLPTVSCGTSDLRGPYPLSRGWGIPPPAASRSQRPWPRIRAGSAGIEGKPGAPKASVRLPCSWAQGHKPRISAKGEEEKNRVESSDIGYTTSP